MTKGETIHTENSLKYGTREARLLLRAGGWSPIAEWTDQNDFFSLILARVGTAAPALWERNDGEAKAPAVRLSR